MEFKRHIVVAIDYVVDQFRENWTGQDLADPLQAAREIAGTYSGIDEREVHQAITDRLWALGIPATSPVRD